MTDPLLNGPTAFTFLAIMLALSAYLRSISEARSTMIDNIEYQIEPTSKLFPLKADHTELKLKYLRSSKRILVVVAHGMIFMTFMVSIRLCAVAYGRWRYPWDSEYLSASFRLFDFGLLAAFALVIGGLWWVHSRGRRFDKRIRKLMSQYKPALEVAINTETIE